MPGFQSVFDLAENVPNLFRYWQTILLMATGLCVGFILGSFLNVCIDRLPKRLSIVKPRSHCLHCNKTLSWFDNIPVLSWLLLKGRCRYCRNTISLQYPLVEIATGLWFLQIAMFFGALMMLPSVGEHENLIRWWINIDFSQCALAVLGFLLIGLIAMDWETGLLPDAFTLTGIAIGFFLVCVQAIFLGPGEGSITLGENHITLRSPGSGHDTGNVFLTGPEALIGGRLLAIIGAAAILLAIRFLYKKFRKQEGMGLGDVKMLAMIAAFLGFWPAVLALFAGVILASLYALTLLARRRATTATALPFGSFLGLGGLIAALFGPVIIAWYSALLH